MTANQLVSFDQPLPSSGDQGIGQFLEWAVLNCIPVDADVLTDDAHNLPVADFQSQRDQAGAGGKMTIG